MLGLRSLRNRLAVVFGMIVLGAIGTIYLSTIPRLEDRLTAQKLEALEADARRAIELGDDSGVAWNLVGAAAWWLGDYRTAELATRRALELDPDDLIVNLNQAEILNINGETAAYAKQLEVVRALFADAPAWQRDGTAEAYYEGIDLALRYRPSVADAERRFRADLRELHQEINVSLRLFGEPDPRPVEATFANTAFSLSEDRRDLRLEFDYEGMSEDLTWLYNTYVDDERDDDASRDPVRWNHDVPDGGLTLTFTRDDRWHSGQEVVTELFVEGNMLGTATFVVPELGVVMEDLELELSEDRTELLLTFDYDGMRSDYEWWWSTYLDEEYNSDLSADYTEKWGEDTGLDVPDGGAVITIPRTGGYRSGEEVRVEVWVMDEEIAAAELTIP